MLLGFVGMGGAEFVREGLRKPWAIDRTLFVNGVWRSPPPGSREALGAQVEAFSVEGLRRDGVLSASQWDRAPSAWIPGDSSLEGLPPEARSNAEAAAGREVFRLLCATCHTTTGHLGIRRLVKGKNVAALEHILDGLARPVNPNGQPTSWNDPQLRLDTWLGRRMPPFTGTEAERHALAVYLARLGGDEAAGTLAPVPSPTGAANGRAVFEQACSPCHGNDALWPMRTRLRNRSAQELYEVIGRLPELKAEMPAFEGTDEERRALSLFLGDVAAGKEQP
jgi:mono/diheme cytochrome c family protein